MKYKNYIVKDTAQVSKDSIIVAASLIKDTAILNNVNITNFEYLYNNDDTIEYGSADIKLIECVICDHAHLCKVVINIRYYMGHPSLYIAGYSYLHNIGIYINPETFNHNDHISFYNATISNTSRDCSLQFRFFKPISFINANINITNNNIDKYIQFFKDYDTESTNDDRLNEMNEIILVDGRNKYTEYALLLTDDILLGLSNI